MYRIVLAIVLAAAPTLAAETNPLSPLDVLAGSCWDGSFVVGPGKKDVHCFTRMYGGKYLRDVHQVDGGPYGGESIYAWDPVAKRIAFTYYDAGGGISRGTLDATGKALVFGDDRYRGPNGEEIVLRTTWTFSGRDAYTAATEQMTADGWKPMMTIAFKRIEGKEPVLKP